MLNLENILIGVPTTLLALTVHECAHGWVSSKLGDPTPRYQGRLTLNPMAHLDIMGTILMILTGFGWAKPVQINPNYYKNRTKGMALVAAAGPIANFLLAFAGMLVGYLLMILFAKLGAGAVVDVTYNIMLLFAWRNLCFMVFNLIPLPPLDGFKVAGMFLPGRIYYKILQYEQYVMILIMLLSFANVFNVIIGNGVMFFMRLISGMIMPIVSVFM